MSARWLLVELVPHRLAAASSLAGGGGRSARSAKKSEQTGNHV